MAGRQAALMAGPCSAAHVGGGTHFWPMAASGQSESVQHSLQTLGLSGQRLPAWRMMIRVARAVSGVGEHTLGEGEAYNCRSPTHTHLSDGQAGRLHPPASRLPLSAGLPVRPRTYDADDASGAVEVELAVGASKAAPIEELAHGAGR